MSGRGQGVANSMQDIWNRIEVKGTNECWPWKGTDNSNGYPVTGFKGKIEKVATLVLEEYKGPVPPGQIVLHRCNHKPCCNPAHLKAGTYTQNALHQSASGKRKDNSSGLTGVKFRKDTRRWIAFATISGKERNLYNGPDFFEACCIRKSWEAKTTEHIFGVQS